MNNKNQTFGEIITNKVHNERKETLRSFFKRLEAKGSKISLIKLSKIMRGIQNPNNKEEFEEIMSALDVFEPEKSQLEKIAQNFVPVKELTEQEIMQRMPIPFGKQFKDEKEINEFLEFFKNTIKKDNEPEP